MHSDVFKPSMTVLVDPRFGVLGNYCGGSDGLICVRNLSDFAGL
jgi:hypothetical protein